MIYRVLAYGFLFLLLGGILYLSQNPDQSPFSQSSSSQSQPSQGSESSEPASPPPAAVPDLKM